jgi:hypothetical protein
MRWARRKVSTTRPTVERLSGDSLAVRELKWAGLLEDDTRAIDADLRC